MNDANVKNILFPLDEEGILESNFIKDEVHTVSSTHGRDYNILVPQYPPFYTKDLKVRYKKNANSKIVDLVEGADYSLGLYYKGASQVLGIPVYGCLLLHDLDLNGVVWLDYRIVGGIHVGDRKHVVETLIEHVWNPLEKDWMYVSDAPNFYPPSWHELDWTHITTLDDLLKALDQLTRTIGESNLELSNKIDTFLKTIDVPKFRRQLEALDQHSYTTLINENRLIKEDIKKQQVLIDSLLPRIKTLENKK